MKRLLLALSIFLVAISFAFAQTKQIAHRSHSGSDDLMSYTREDNFGLPGDKVLFVEDTITQEKMWVRVIDWGRDSVTVRHHGFKLASDSGFEPPQWEHVQSIDEAENHRKPSDH